jgi:microcystin-dependent protein
MAADTFDAILGLIQQGTGNNNNAWGTTFNNSFAALCARAIGGVATRSNTGGSLDLSTSPPPAGPRIDIDAIQLFNGALVSDLTVTVPLNSKMTFFQNSTSGAFNLFVKVPSGVAPLGLIQIPQGAALWVMSDGNGNLIRDDDEDIGAFRISGKAAAGAGELACNGASLLRASFPNLFAKIGTTWGSADGTHFTLPNLTDTGRFLRSSASGVPVGTYQANQNKSHTHTGSGTTGTDSVAHSHTFSGSTGAMSANASHGHPSSTANQQGGSIGGSVAGTALYGQNTSGLNVLGPLPLTITVTNTDHTHTFSGTTTTESVDHTHSFSFTTSTGSADGAEARPETAVALICIRY